MKADTKFKAARRLQNNRLCPGRLQVDEWSIFQCAALEHWRGLDHALFERFFSVNRDVLHGLMSLQEYMNRPASAEQPRGLSLRSHDTNPLLCDLGPDATDDKIVFKVVALTLAQKNFVRVSIGAGTKLKDTQLCDVLVQIAQHRPGLH